MMTKDDNTMLLYYRMLLIIISVMFSANIYASMSLDKMIVYFDTNKQPRQDIIVTNPDKDTLYLETEVYEIKNPGAQNEERVKVTDPAQLKLLTTPNKAIIPANSRKTIRLVSLEKPKGNESVYRVTFKPVIGNLKADQTEIKLLIAYQALVFVRPDNPEYNVSVKQKGNQIIFTNTGNINVVMRNGRSCTTDKNNSCRAIKKTTRLYAGQSWTLDIPSEAVRVKYGLFDGAFEKTQQFIVQARPEN